MASQRIAWVYWLAVTALVGGYLAYTLFSEDKQVFVPGETTHGHYQIEMACSVCHSSPFGGMQVLQDACINCHGEELKAVDDSHPKSKFTDPRNAARVEVLDARLCVTCHVEHKPDMTHAMGVTLEDDFCFECHADIADDRPSHQGMDFKTCATGGCHNFHDNTALYEDFLIKHLDEPELHAVAQVARRDLATFMRTVVEYPPAPLTMAVHDAPTDIKVEPMVAHDWEMTAHAQAGVNCLDCHGEKDPVSRQVAWIDRPDHKSCANCHSAETEGFLAGKHGMRLAQGLSPMSPGMARQPMKPTAHDKTLTCVACHSAHRFDTRHAAVEACMSCHDDGHTQAYKASPHFGLWHREITGQAKAGTGVSCATCHLPREVHSTDDGERILVQHNQNLNLRPNEKMIRGVCMNCHGLGFSIDALADPVLVQNNFAGRPAAHIESLDLAKRRMKKSAPAD